MKDIHTMIHSKNIQTNKKTEKSDSILICPICGDDLLINEDSGQKNFSCKNNHSFDRAKSGYLNLSHKQKVSGDNKDMVLARTRFLEEGYYSFMADEVINLLKKLHPENLIDIGCGEGWYTRQFSKYADHTYGVDLSKEAILHASKNDNKTQYIVASIYRLPFRADSADVIVSIFTPIPEEEIYRVLKPGGTFISVSPGVMHHYELKEVLYDKVRLNDEPVSLDRLKKAEVLKSSLKVHVKDPMSLLDMTPYRYKCPKEGLQRLEEKKDGLNVTFDFIISVYRKEAE